MLPHESVCVCVYAWVLMSYLSFSCLHSKTFFIWVSSSAFRDSFLNFSLAKLYEEEIRKFINFICNDLLVLWHGQYWYAQRPTLELDSRMLPLLSLYKRTVSINNFSKWTIAWPSYQILTQLGQFLQYNWYTGTS